MTDIIQQGLLRPTLAVLLLLTAATQAGAGWEPARFGDESTLRIRTVGPDEGEHWSSLWLVVLDDQVYLRLGNRAARRVERNTTAPYVDVEIAGEQFTRMRAVSAPEMTERVAEAMADKYFTDLFVRWFPHTMTVRLSPAMRTARSVSSPR